MRYKNTDLAFISGVFDSKGFIKIDIPKKSKQPSSDSELPSLYLWITSKSFKLMEFLQKFNAKVNQRPDMQYKATWKNGGAYSLLKDILPYLKVKKEQAEVGLEFFQERINNPTNPREKLIPLMLRLRLMRKGNDED